MAASVTLYQESWSLIHEARDLLNQLPHSSLRLSDLLRNLMEKLDRIELSTNNGNVSVQNEGIKQLELLRSNAQSIQQTFYQYQQGRDPGNRFTSKDHTIIQIDDELLEHQRLTRVHNSIHEMIDIASTSRSRIKYQDEMLKNTQNQLVSIFSRLGLSSTVLRLIQRRVRGDKIVFISGVCLVLFIIMVLVFFY